MFESASSSDGVLEDVQLAELQSLDSGDYVYVETTGIPNYDIEITEEILDGLSSRPRAATDFVSGVPLVSVGDVVSFGQNVGYSSSTENCDSTGGSGYWPPGPGCPIDTGKAEYFTTTPQPAITECSTGLGTTGLMVNGTSVFDWGDGMSWGIDIWYTLAPVAEQYDVDICGGHAAQGEYHHHFYTSCLADLLGDTGSSHSPIYGFSADGYPLYGPYESSNTLAISAWNIRDYGADESSGGCGTPGERSCVMVDEYDLSQGVDTTVSAGPDIGETVTTLSGNSLSADDGYFYEDYYYRGAEATGAQLDQHNGHDNGDGRGYHYHITLTEGSDGKLVPSFPYTMGPSFYGELPDNAVRSCDGGGAGGPPAGADGPGGPPPTGEVGAIITDGPSEQDVIGLDPELFVAGALLSPVTTQSCTLSGGTSSSCYRIEIAGTPADHDVGPFCPPNISSSAEEGGIWLDGNSTDAYKLSGEFIAGLSEFYGDNNWLLYDPATGDVNITDTQEAFEAAARPNVAPEYQNHCVEGDMSYVGGGVSQTFLIPVTPVLVEDSGSVNNDDVGVSLNGIALAPPAPVDAILGAYTIAAFDDCGGHINPFEGYHYHAATECVEAGYQPDGHAPVIGFALDGFSILAMLNENGTESEDLDECRGHSDELRGYHYHAAGTGENMFIACYRGETGSVE
tara:strand:+ start:3852 stop:5894 length:2043 start_codon:yes stop_codon:yes gene_type:complete